MQKFILFRFYHPCDQIILNSDPYSDFDKANML